MFVTDIMSGLSAEEITEKVVQAVDPNSSTEEKDRILELVQSTKRTMKNILDFTKNKVKYIVIQPCTMVV